MLIILVAGCSRKPPTNAVIPVPAHEQLPEPKVGPIDWPWWRGRNGDGISQSATAPLEWGSTENVVWKTAVPGVGWSSPIVVGERIFLTTAEEDRQTKSILCLRRSDGQLLWSTVAHRGRFMRKHEKNSHASATAACDGERVFAAFIHDGQLWMTATDLDGQILWQTAAGRFRSQHGYGSSLAIVGSLVIIAGDNIGGGFLAALHRKTGKIVWRVLRPNESSYGSPIVARLAGREQLILAGAGSTTSYSPATGERIWYCTGPAKSVANTIAIGRDFVVSSGGYPEREILCIAADGIGDVTTTHVRWRTSKGMANVPSPLIVGDRVFIVDDKGIASCLTADAGKSLWTRRLGGSFSASPVWVDGLIHIVDESGVCHRFHAADRFEKIARNEIGEECLATPVFAGDSMFIRSKENVLRIRDISLAPAAQFEPSK